MSIKSKQNCLISIFMVLMGIGSLGCDSDPIVSNPGGPLTSPNTNLAADNSASGGGGGTGLGSTTPAPPAYITDCGPLALASTQKFCANAISSLVFSQDSTQNYITVTTYYGQALLAYPFSWFSNAPTVALTLASPNPAFLTGGALTTITAYLIVTDGARFVNYKIVGTAPETVTVTTPMNIFGFGGTSQPNTTITPTTPPVAGEVKLNGSICINTITQEAC